MKWTITRLLCLCGIHKKGPIFAKGSFCDRCGRTLGQGRTTTNTEHRSGDHTDANDDNVCGSCYWFAAAALDGDPDKGICNLGTGQKRPFTMSAGDNVKLAYAEQTACESYEPVIGNR